MPLLFLGGARPALSDDPHFQVDCDVAVQLHGNFVFAQPLDRVGEIELAAIELEALRGERVGDVLAGDRSVERLGLAHLAADLELDVGHPIGDGLR